MGKKWCAALLCALLMATLTGCSLLDREWYEVKDHSPTYYEGEGRDVLRADTYQDLVNNILIFVGNHAETGTIWLYYAQEGLDASEAAEKACREVEKVFSNTGSPIPIHGGPFARSPSRPPCRSAPPTFRMSER